MARRSPRPLAALACAALLPALAGCADDDPLLRQIETVLFQPEAEEYTPSCDDRLERAGDVVVRGPADAAALSGVTLIHGDLVIVSSGAARLSTGLNCVEVIEGDLRISDTSDLEAFTDGAFEHIERIDGDLLVQDNPRLANPLPLFALETVGGDIRVEGNGAFRSVGSLDALTEVGGSVVMRDNPALNHVPTFAGVGVIGGDFILERTGLNTLESPSPRVEGSVIIVDNDQLETAALPEPSAAGGDVLLTGNAVLTSVTGGIAGAIALPTSGRVQIAENPALTSVQGFAGISEVTGPFQLRDNVSLAGVTGFASLSRVTGGVEVRGNPVLSVLASFAAVTAVENGFVVEENDALTALQAPALATVGGGLSIRYHPALSMLQLGSLSSVSGPLDISHNPALSSCAAEAVADQAVAGGLDPGLVNVADNGGC